MWTLGTRRRKRPPPPRGYLDAEKFSDRLARRLFSTLTGARTARRKTFIFQKFLIQTVGYLKTRPRHMQMMRERVCSHF